jgi:hypothetical protein
MNGTDLPCLPKTLPNLLFALEQVSKTARSRNNNVPTPLHPVSHLVTLTHTTNKEANFEVLVVMSELHSFIGNLRRELSGRANNQSANLCPSENTLGSIHEVLVSVQPSILDSLI